VKISFVVKRIATDVLLFLTEFCLYNKQKNTWVLGNIRFISRVTRNKSGISAHPCIILYFLLHFPRELLMIFLTNIIYELYQYTSQTSRTSCMHSKSLYS
jgi:hypothetical protein